MTGIRKSKIVENSRKVNHFRADKTITHRNIVKNTCRENDGLVTLKADETAFPFFSRRISVTSPEIKGTRISH